MQIGQAVAQRLQKLKEQQAHRERLETQYGVVLSGDWEDRAVAWLAEKWGNARACPYCSNPDWGVGAKLIEARPWGEDGVVPMLQVTCTNCGHTVSVDASVAGLVHYSPKP
jgi:hypothetical protein